jgi:hypothetical protein
MRKEPKLRLPKSKRRVRFVNGFSMRYMVPDLDICIWREKEGMVRTSFVPKDEIWIDWRYKREAQLLIDSMRIESMPRFEGAPYAEVRRELNSRLCKRGKTPDFVVRKERHGALTIKYVKGDIVRLYFDPAFIFGGHDLV